MARNACRRLAEVQREEGKAFDPLAGDMFAERACKLQSSVSGVRSWAFAGSARFLRGPHLGTFCRRPR